MERDSNSKAFPRILKQTVNKLLKIILIITRKIDYFSQALIFSEAPKYFLSYVVVKNLFLTVKMLDYYVEYRPEYSNFKLFHSYSRYRRLFSL